MTSTPPRGHDSVVLPALVQVLARSDRRTVGYGVLVGPRMVVTCLHVVANSLWDDARKQDHPGAADVLVNLPYLEQKRIYTAEVVAWQPTAEDSAGDIAGLLIKDDVVGLPEGARPLALARGISSGGHDFITYGYQLPERAEAAAWVAGKIVGLDHRGMIQLGFGADPNKLRIVPGFSGSPVWDQQTRQVVGLVSQVLSKTEKSLAYAVAADDIYRAWPELREYFKGASPFRAVRAFGPEDGEVFFGRDDLAERAVDQIMNATLTLVTGPSGVGKTSLMAAAVHGRLTARGLAVLTISVKSTLWYELADKADPGLGDVERLRLAEHLRESDVGVALDVICRQAHGDRLVIVVDQFEYLLQAGGRGADAFADGLLDLTRVRHRAGGPVARVVLVVRDDLEGAVRALPGYANAIDGVVSVEPLTDDQMRDAVKEPIRRLGGSFEHDLVDRIVDDLRGQPHRLSRLQAVLDALWQRLPADGMLRHTDYQETRQDADPLAATAEKAWGALVQADKEAASRLLLHLVTPREGGGFVRRPAVGEELDPPQWDIAGRLASAEARVVAVSAGPSGTAIFELGHDALLSAWPTLATLLDDSAELLRWRAEIRRRIVAWNDSGRRRGELPRGSVLADGLRLAREQPADLTVREQEFLRNGQLWQRARRLGAAATALLACLVLVATFAVVAAVRDEREQARAAERERRGHAAQALLRLASGQRDSDPVTALRLNLAARALAPAVEVEAALATTVAASPFSRLLSGHEATIEGMAASADGRLLATSDWQNAVILWDVADPLHPRRLAYLGTSQPGAACVCPGAEVALSPDGRTLATLPLVGTSVGLWDLTDPTRPRQVGSASVPVGPVRSLTFSPRGNMLVTTVPDGALVWDVADPALPQPLDLGTGGDAYGPAPAAIAYAADATVLAVQESGRVGGVTVWDGNDPAHPRPLARIERVSRPRLSPDGRLLAVAGPGQTVTLYDLSQPLRPRPLGTLGQQPQGVGDTAFAPDGHTVAIGGNDGAVTLWDVRDPRRPRRMKAMRGHTDRVRFVQFLVNGRALASGGDDRKVLLWDATMSRSPRQVGEVPAASGAVTSAAFRRDGRLLATGGADRAVRLWEVGPDDRPRNVATLAGVGGAVTAVAFSPDGVALAIGAADGTVRLYDLTDPRRPQRQAVLRPYEDDVTSVAFSPDGRLLAAATDDDPAATTGDLFDQAGVNGGRTTLWRLEPPGRQPRHVGSITTGLAGLSSVAFHPATPILALGGDLMVTDFYDVTDPSAPRKAADMAAAASGPAALAFTPHGRAMAISAGASVALYDVTDPSRPLRAKALSIGTTPVHAVAATDELLAVGLDDGTTALLGLTSLGSPAPLTRLPGRTSRVRAIAFGAGGLLAVADDSGTLALWRTGALTAAVTDPAGEACAMVGRGFTKDEWRRYVEGGIPYADTC